MSAKKEVWFVEVVEVAKEETGGPEKVIKRMGPILRERDAERIMRGADINLNHERFFTRIVTGER